MMEKRFKSTNIEAIAGQSVEHILGQDAVGKPKGNGGDTFPKGTKYMFGDKVWFVVRSWVDNATQFRRVHSDMGDDFTLEVHTLVKDSQSDGFSYLEPTDMERLKIRAMVD
jgi:hypothetical protein